MALRELIDTQWDVNLDNSLDGNLSQARINRYIVGCKFLEMKIDRHGATELIDTQWDVNFSATNTAHDVCQN